VVHKAACLAKTDLTTELVKEFTELQGIVGGLYAGVQDLDRGMPNATRQLIAQTIYDQYKPESADDAVPRTVEGAVLSIADKADTIAGMFALGLQPTGSKDPFALRRQANGIVRTIAEHKLPIRTSDLFELAVETFKGSAAEAKFKHDFSPQAAIGKFFRERLEFYLREQLGYAYDTVNAVLASGYDDVVLTVSRADAVSKMRHSADFESICAAFKRINNILQQAYASGTSTATLDSNRFVQPEENELFEKMRNANTAFLRLSSQGHYLEALTELSRLRQPIDKFFDKVLVMAPEEAIRANRIALLETLENGFSAIADFSEIVAEGKA
jgi:glycyl-tRNA synthetase beta chain